MPEYRLSEKGAQMLTAFEAMVLHPYADQGGLETVCVGHVVKPEDQVWLRDGVTRNECLAVLNRDVKRFEDGINDMVHVPISQPMTDALVSLVFNIGLGAFAKSSVLAYLNQREYTQAADAFLLWKYARVKLRNGSYEKRPILLGRRMAEARLFRSGILQAMGALSGGEPSLQDLLAKVHVHQFDLFELLPEHPAIESEDPSQGEPALTEDGRMVALPPRAEDNEPQAG